MWRLIAYPLAILAGLSIGYLITEGVPSCKTVEWNGNVCYCPGNAKKMGEVTLFVDGTWIADANRKELYEHYRTKEAAQAAVEKAITRW